jgi:hypothetical protein
MHKRGQPVLDGNSEALAAHGTVNCAPLVHRGEERGEQTYGGEWNDITQDRIVDFCAKGSCKVARLASEHGREGDRVYTRTRGEGEDGGAVDDRDCAFRAPCPAKQPALLRPHRHTDRGDVDGVWGDRDG